MNKLSYMVLTIALLCISSISYANQTDAVSQLSKQAQETARNIAANATVHHEIEMIQFKREVMGRAGLQLYVVFLNEFGQPLDYFVTDGKCSSSRKRLTKTWNFQEGQTGKDSDGYAVYGDFVMPTASLDGTFGNSDAYIYCKTVDGKYKQWNGRYYASDAPIELTTKALTLKLKE